jgi:hypothetical protein
MTYDQILSYAFFLLFIIADAPYSMLNQLHCFPLPTLLFYQPFSLSFRESHFDEKKIKKGSSNENSFGALDGMYKKALKFLLY